MLFRSILRSRARPYFVQFCRYGAAVRMEAVSNHYLAKDARLSPSSQRVLLMAGWQSPTHDPDSPWPDLAGSPNYHRDIPHPSAAHDMAALAVQTLRTVYGVPTPAALTYKAVALAGTVIRLPILGITRRRT